MIDYVDMIFFYAVISPNKPALIDSKETLTYANLRSAILSVEQQLLQSGLGKPHCVGIKVSNAIRHVILICALHRAGIPSVSLDTSDLLQLESPIVNVLLTDEPPRAQTSVSTILINENWFSGKSVSTESFYRDQSSDELCRVVLSSGTTGRPKMIGLTYEAVRQRLISYAVRISTPSWDRIVVKPGLSSNYGYSFAIMTLWLGRTICLAYKGDARPYIISYQAELLVASTQQIQVLVRAQQQRFMPLDSLRAIHIGGSIAYPALRQGIRTLVCRTLYCGYGSTEGGTIAYSPAETIYGEDRAVGMLVPWVSFEVRDEHERSVDFGQQGEIRLKAYGQGHLLKKNSPGEYAMDKSEWIYPGDIGVLFRNGMVRIDGRVNEIINKGGLKVAPDLIEEALRQHPDVHDAGVVGVPDDLGIEKIWACVSPRDGAKLDMDKISAFCRKALPVHSPDRLFVVNEIPRNRLGKISRQALKEQLIAAANKKSV